MPKLTSIRIRIAMWFAYRVMGVPVDVRFQDMAWFRARYPNKPAISVIR